MPEEGSKMKGETENSLHQLSLFAAGTASISAQFRHHIFLARVRLLQPPTLQKECKQSNLHEQRVKVSKLGK